MPRTLTGCRAGKLASAVARIGGLPPLAANLKWSGWAGWHDEFTRCVVAWPGWLRLRPGRCWLRFYKHVDEQGRVTYSMCR